MTERRYALPLAKPGDNIDAIEDHSRNGRKRVRPAIHPMTAFGAWLVSQQDRAGWIGELAKAAKADRKFPRNGDPDDVRKHLVTGQADSDMLEAMNDAENVWLAL